MFTSIQHNKFLKNPFILFTPFLLLYTLLVIAFPTDGTFGDENRYLEYANLISTGFSGAGSEMHIGYLGNGPGYPILLIPFVALKLPLVLITIMNAVFYYLSIVFLYKTLSQIASFSVTFILCLFWACYYNLYEYVVVIYTETFCIFLISLIAYYLVSAFKKNNQGKHSYLAGFLFGYLALTKPIFGYVMLCMVIACTVLWLLYRKGINYRKSLVVVLIALATTAPYLIYTYSLTGRVFYWSSFGGNNLYWMSTPAEKEYGDWFSDPDAKEYPNPKNMSGYKLLLKQTHGEDFKEIDRYKGVERDDAFKRIAIENIKNHPAKFIQNCVYNLSRILFNYPYSYTLQKPATLMRLPMNGLIVVLLLLCAIPTFRNWLKISFAIRFLLFFAMLYLGGSILGSAETRMFILIVPPLLIFIAYMLTRSVSIRLTSWKEQDKTNIG